MSTFLPNNQREDLTTSKIATMGCVRAVGDVSIRSAIILRVDSCDLLPPGRDIASSTVLGLRSTGDSGTSWSPIRIAPTCQVVGLASDHNSVGSLDGYSYGHSAAFCAAGGPVLVICGTAAEFALVGGRYRGLSVSPS